jgi:CheY-like chemotaxis protein
VALASLEVRHRGEDLGDRRERTELTRCSGEGANRAGFGGPSCVVVAQVGGEERHILEATLKQGGFNVVPADDGVAALELVCAVGPDAIIADLDGRDLDGLVLCQVLRGLRAYAGLPVLVLTTTRGNAARARTLRGLDGVEVMQKPVGSAAVARALSEMISIAGAPATIPLSPRAALR